MKNKKLTWFLLLIAVPLWGLIIYRIFVFATGSGDDTIQAVSENNPKEPYNDYTLQKDTTHLLLNYRDPFGLVKFKDTADAPVHRGHPKSFLPIIAKPAFDWGFIKYSGYIRNPGSRKIVTLVSINGKNEMFSEGETRDQVRLIRNLRDSIRVSYHGQTKVISLKSSAL